MPLHGAERVAEWKALVEGDRWLELVGRLLVEHYDPSYDRSMRRNFGRLSEAPVVRLEGTDDASLDRAAGRLATIGATP